MTNRRHQPILSFFLFTLLMVSCQSIQEESQLDAQIPTEEEGSIGEEEEREVIDFVEKLLFAAGNKDVEAMREMILDEALVGNTFMKDSMWITNLWDVDEIYEIYQGDQSKPYLEIVEDYEIIATDRLALVKADATINQFGVPGKRELNHITLMKFDDQWKLFSIAWSVHEQPKEKLKFDINLFARGYAQVWGSKRPDFVAMFFEEGGSLQVNEGDPAVGRNAISDVAQGFMTQFPDMSVSFDSIVHKTNEVEFHWTLTGTDASPEGKGHKVNINGYEVWTMSEANLIKDSRGYFSSEEYNRQLEHGINH